jgi:hypothetical protein
VSDVPPLVTYRQQKKAIFTNGKAKAITDQL